MLHRERDGGGPLVMAQAIRDLMTQRPPSTGHIPGLLDGLDTIAARLAPHATLPVRAAAHGG
jgi:hypothetical protein